MVPFTRFGRIFGGSRPTNPYARDLRALWPNSRENLGATLVDPLRGPAARGPDLDRGIGFGRTETIAAIPGVCHAKNPV